MRDLFPGFERFQLVPWYKRLRPAANTIFNQGLVGGVNWAGLQFPTTHQKSTMDLTAEAGYRLRIHAACSRMPIVLILLINVRKTGS